MPISMMLKAKPLVRRDIWLVRTHGIQTTIQNVSQKRGDDWSREVERRISIVSDLVAAEARYHNKGCYLPYIKCKSAPMMSVVHAY